MKLFARIITYSIFAGLLAGMFGGCLEVKPLPSVLARLEAQKGKSNVNPNVVYRFFDEDFAAGGYEYHYPDESKVFIAEESGKNGEVAVEMDLVANDYSGGAIVLWNCMYDLRQYYRTGALQFWIKGKNGGEVCNVELADDELGDGIKTEVRVPINDYVDITTDWTFVSIPLADFGKRGVYWDEKKQIEIPNRFDWDKVTEFIITIEKGKNKEFVIWLDDIFIVKDVFPPADTHEVYWDEIKEVVSVDDFKLPSNVTTVNTIFEDELLAGAYTSVYGGKTAITLQPTNKPDQNKNVLAFYMDNSDYSGASIVLPSKNKLDLTKIRENNGGIGFWAKFSKGVEQVFFAVLDDNSDDKKVQVTVPISDYGKLDTTWKFYMIPLKDFGHEGAWWDEDKQIEVPGVIDWSKIDEISFTTDKYGNRIPEEEPVKFYVDKIVTIDKIPGYVDPEEYWKKFTSNAPDMLLFDFEDGAELWDAISGDESDIFFTLVDSPDREKYGRKVMKIEYSLNDWADVLYGLEKNSMEPEKRDWSKYWGIMFDFYTERDTEIITVQINDEGNEGWVTNVTCVQGWNKILVPFKKFRKDPYYQEADARVDGKFDLKGVKQISFKPGKLGMTGSFMLDNITLTVKKKVE